MTPLKPVMNLLRLWYRVMPDNWKRVLVVSLGFIILHMGVDDFITVLDVADVWRFVWLGVWLMLYLTALWWVDETGDEDD